MLSTPVTVPSDAAVPGDVGREEVPGPLRVVPVEDLGNELARDRHPLVDRERLDSCCFASFVSAMST